MAKASLYVKESFVNGSPDRGTPSMTPLSEHVLVRLEVRGLVEPAELEELPVGGPHQVGHRHRARLLGGEVRGGQGDAADVAAGQLEPLGEQVEIHVRG